ncbi:glycosyltransferase [Actinotalea solisilvae]|uniref:glycosyltransferase n=1 Tax=Actinotalea solisilvae TaxID=2072922 RepID=UPI0018F20DA8|nr:glycosyltransferase [Actinotalea solisilvae]
MSQVTPQVPAPSPRPRVAAVTAVLVTRGVTEYVEESLAALLAQSRPPERVLLVDAAASDADDHAGETLHAVLARVRAAAADAGAPAPGVPPVPPVRLVEAHGARTFGHAVRRALAADDDAAAAGPSGPAGPPAWLWLLHDDSAPEATALAELLRAVEAAPSVAVAGCKQRTWGSPVRVLEVGLSTSRFGRRMTGIDEPEVEQGQHDGREDVLGVGIAGALVRRDAWDDLGGTDPALGPYGDGLDLSRRARLAGHRVVVVPRAVVRHAQASLALPVGGAVLNRPGWDARRSAQARREAFVHSQLVGVPLGLVPVVALLAVASGVVRALGRFVTKEPHLVVAELLAPWAVLVRSDRVVRARRAATRTRRTRRAALRPLQETWRDVVRQLRDRRLAAAERRRLRRTPSELEIAELSALRARRRGTLAVVVVGAVAVSAAVLGPLITRVLAGERLTGGDLAAGDADRGALWASATSGWVAGGLGHPGPSDPFLLVLAPVAAVLGSAGLAAAVLLLGSVVLAAAGAWFAAGAVTRSVVLRAWASLVWTAAPALLVGLAHARLGAVVAHAALPWVALGVARAVGHARVDVVESGLVGAQRVGGPRGDEPARAPHEAEPSLAAAAGAGLALAVVVAAAPVLLPAGLLALLVVAAAVRRRRRLVWVAVPALVLQAPTVLDAVSEGADGWRVLLAAPGVPTAASAAEPWQQLLGWPTAAPAWVDLPDVASGVVPYALTGVVAVVALLGLVVPGRRGRAARAAWLVAACGLAAGVVAGAVHTGVADVPGDAPGTVLAPGWAGPGVSLALLGLLVAALVGAAGLRTVVGRHAFGWRQVTAGVLAVLAVVAPATVLGAWTWHSTGARDLALTTSAVPVVPAIGRQLQASPDDVRVLLLEPGPDEQVRATALRHDGVQLTEVGRSVTARAVRGAPDAPAAVAADAADTELAGTAARLASGAAGDVAAQLARLGVGAVLVPPAGDDPQAAAARAAVVGRVDATAGLERVTETESGIIWRVAGAQAGTTTARARLVTPAADAPGAGETPGSQAVAVPAHERVVDAPVAAGDPERLLVLAERADPGWRAWLDGRPLRSVESSWRQTFELGDGSGQLTVRYDPGGRTPWLALQGLTLLVTVLLALPVRRRRGGPR